MQLHLSVETCDCSEFVTNCCFFSTQLRESYAFPIVLHSDFFVDEPCKGQLVEVESTERMYEIPKGCKVLWCRQCGTEFRYMPGSGAVTLIYTGFVRKQ